MDKLLLENNKIYFKYKNGAKKTFNIKYLEVNNIDMLPITNEKEAKIRVELKNNNGIMEVYSVKNELLSSINLLYFGCESFKILDDKYILVFTKNFYDHLIFSKDGKLLAQISKYYTRPINVSYNNGYLLIGDKSNAIDIFNLDSLEKLSLEEEILDGAKYDISDPKAFIDNVNESFIKYFQKDSSYDFGYIPTVEQIKKFLKIEGLQKREILAPLSSLYIKNNDWILYNPQGLFAYGGDGKNFIKYHQNQGVDKEAKVIENERLFEKFYRPDLLQKILNKEEVKFDLDVKSVLLNIKPPRLEIVDNKLVNDKELEVTYQICDEGSGVSEPSLVVNGTSINLQSSRGFTIEKLKKVGDKCQSYKNTISLNPGSNTVALKAYDKEKTISSKSDTIEVFAKYTLEKKPNMYFLSIAVSDYENKSLTLKYPVNDVRTVKEKIEQKSKSVYEKIYTFELNNADTTTANISKAFDTIAKKIQPNDVFILYIAGHGTTKDGLYHFLPYSSKETLSISELKNNLSKIITNKALVLLDTCQSGSAIENMMNDTSTITRLSSDDKRNYIVASTQNQVALEGYKEHGLFTYSFLDAFEKTQKLKVWGLAEHISDLVPKISFDNFHFKQIPEARLNVNFPLTEN